MTGHAVVSYFADLGSLQVAVDSNIFCSEGSYGRQTVERRSDTVGLPDYQVNLGILYRCVILVVVAGMITDIDQAFRGCFPMAGVAMLVIHLDTLNMVGIGFHLSHDVHSSADRTGMAFGAVTRQTKGSMFRNRLAVFMTAVAVLLFGMTLGKTVLMA